MALATYSDLVTSIGNWLVRGNEATFTAAIPDFIVLFESQMIRELRTRDMESRTAFTITGEFTPLPTGFVEMRNFRLTSPEAALSYITPEAMDLLYSNADVDQPEAYTILDTEIRVGPPPDVNYAAEMELYSFVALSPANPTNWLMTRFPDCYLFGSLAAASAFIEDDPRMQLWQQMAANAIDAVKRQDVRARWNGGTLVMRPDIVTP